MYEGFVKIEQFLFGSPLDKLEFILKKFHKAWIAHNGVLYKNGAINSAYITSGDFLSAQERLELLKFVGSKQVVGEAEKFLGTDLRFLNTQLFFNPLKSDQKNYWHRDIQYTEQTEAAQIKVIEAQKSQVIHLRLALADENGIELVPESHYRWDRPEEFEVRMQQNGKTSSDQMKGSKEIPLKRGDLLIFDANIIHRGLYGQDRFAFDMLFCKPLPEFIQYVDKKTLPLPEEMASIERGEVFNA